MDKILDKVVLDTVDRQAFSAILQNNLRLFRISPSEFPVS
jgi:hypothetical protein